MSHIRANLDRCRECGSLEGFRRASDEEVRRFDITLDDWDRFVICKECGAFDSREEPPEEGTDADAEKTLTVSVIEAYGKLTIRPQCETSRLFCELLGQKTLTEENVEAIKALGYVIKVKEFRL